MSRLRSHPLAPVVVLIGLVLLFPALATALPLGKAAVSAAERPDAALGLFSQLWGLLSAVWSGNGSILEPNGGNAGASSGSSAEPGEAGSGDNGSGLEPNG